MSDQVILALKEDAAGEAAVLVVGFGAVLDEGDLATELVLTVRAVNECGVLGADVAVYLTPRTPPEFQRDWDGRAHSAAWHWAGPPIWAGLHVWGRGLSFQTPV